MCSMWPAAALTVLCQGVAPAVAGARTLALAAAGARVILFGDFLTIGVSCDYFLGKNVEPPAVLAPSDLPETVAQRLLGEQHGLMPPGYPARMMSSEATRH